MNHIILRNKSLLTMATVLVLVSAACSSPDEKTEVPQKNDVKTISYPTVPVKFLNPEYEISVPAELKPFEQVEVHARVSGFVKQLLVERGDFVRKGQLLAELEAPEMNQTYLSDKSTEQKLYGDFQFAIRTYERLVDASKTEGAVAAIELERAKSLMESAEATYNASKAGSAHSSQLQQYLRITAPFDGIITNRNISVGALVGTGANLPLFMMAQGKKLRLTLSLPEKHAASVKKGMKATFTVSSQPGKTFAAELSRTSGLLDQQDRSLTLEFDVENSSGELQGGDYAQVKLKLQRKNSSYWVPTQSVLSTQRGTYILTLNEKKMQRIHVKEGIQLDSLTEVFGDLSPSDNVLLKPSEEIKEGIIN